MLKDTTADRPAVAAYEHRATGLRFLLNAVGAAQTLSFYGAAGIASCGWALGHLLHFYTRPYVPLWFAGALFVYNIDRLKADPSDPINTPRRSRRSLRLRPAAALTASLAAAALLLVPILERDWLSLLFTLAGGLVCLAYSIPFLGFRLKDVPLLKTFFAPSLVAAAYFVQPMAHIGPPPNLFHVLAAASWTFSFLLFNMTLCDLRDLEGDRRMRTLSLPVVIGARHTFRVLAGLLVLLAVFTPLAAWGAHPNQMAVWLELGGASLLYLGFLLLRAREPQTESFYEWWVEGMLFLPAVAVLANR